MTVLVFGASSQVGCFLLPRLCSRGESVLAVSRREQSLADGDGPRWLRGALPDQVPQGLPPVSAIVCFGPLGPFAQWLERAAPAGAPRIVATSSMSAASKADSVVSAERAVSQALRDGEQRLAAACTRLGCAWTVLRPTLIYGAGLDKSLTPLARRALRLRVFALPAGRGLRQPVHADDLAQAVLTALDAPGAVGKIIPVGGGERLTAACMFVRVRRSLPRATLPLPVPAWVLRVAAHVLPRLRGPLLRLQSDLVADNGELERCLGLQPRPFRPTAACWRLPARD